MKNIKEYRKRFFSLLESEMGDVKPLITEQVSETPICSDSGCKGRYSGPEFNNQGDIAHQYSNVITKSVSKKLKDLYNSGNYVKVNFDSIKMTTKGMGSGTVVYEVEIPFMSTSKCDSMTGFAHVGGWNHTPELNSRKRELLSYIAPNETENMILDDKLYVSELKKTKEGLQEYFIQWKNRKLQSDCSSKNNNLGEKDKIKRLNEKTVVIDHNGDPNILRKKLKELGVIINLIWNRLNENSIEIKYLPQCPEDRECYKKRMSYVFSDRGEEKEVLEKVEEANPNLSNISPFNVGDVKGFIVSFRE